MHIFVFISSGGSLRFLCASLFLSISVSYSPTRAGYDLILPGSYLFKFIVNFLFMLAASFDIHLYQSNIVMAQCMLICGCFQDFKRDF